MPTLTYIHYHTHLHPKNNNSNRQTLFFRAAMFTVGLASSLSVLGLSATLAGKLFGSVRGRLHRHRHRCYFVQS